MVEELVATGMARFVFQHFPIRSEASWYAAVVVECAANQGGFWPMHDRFMAGDETLFTEAGLRRQVVFEGLEFGELWQCVIEGQTLPLVQASRDEGSDRGVAGTPAVFVDGVKVDPTFEAIEEAVKRAAEAASP